MPFDSIGKSLVLVGAAVLILGLVIMMVGKVPGLGRLPGDIVWQRNNVSIYIPIVTSIVISVVLTILLNLVGGYFGRR
ncbi:MAG: DUF2905 domain-containing protein [Chloroflexota bacterium]